MDQNVNAKSPTLGEYRVGITFNPGGYQLVNNLKKSAALLIDHAQGNWNDDSFAKTVKEYEYAIKIGKDQTTNVEAGRCYRLAEAYFKSGQDALKQSNLEAAQNDFETSAMWAVKGATKPDQPEQFSKLQEIQN